MPLLRWATCQEVEARISRITSLLVKVGAVAFVVLISPQFSVDLQLIGGVIILQTLPSVGVSAAERAAEAAMDAITEHGGERR